MKKAPGLIREIPDFPKQGILFRDITPLLGDAEAFDEVITALAAQVPADCGKIIAVEARGFILGAALAMKTGKGFVPVRKPGKLPALTVKEEYQLEYGTDALEMHRDGVLPGEKVVIVDDVLATGGTAAAACRLVEACKGRVVKVMFLIELTGLKGRGKLTGREVFSLLQM